MVHHVLVQICCSWPPHKLSSVRGATPLQPPYQTLHQKTACKQCMNLVCTYWFWQLTQLQQDRCRMSKCWTASKCPEQVCCCSVGTITAGNAVGSAGTLPWIMLTLGMMSRKACVLHSFGDAFVHVTLAADSKGGGGGMCWQLCAKQEHCDGGACKG